MKLLRWWVSICKRAKYHNYRNPNKESERRIAMIWATPALIIGELFIGILWLSPLHINKLGTAAALMFGTWMVIGLYACFMDGVLNADEDKY